MQVRPPGDAVTVKLAGSEPVAAAVTVTVALASAADATGTWGASGAAALNVHHVSPVALLLLVHTAFT